MRSPNCSSCAGPEHARREHGDLLAAPAGDDVGRPEPVHEAADDLDQDLVADPVAEAVVDRLEAVEIHDEEARRNRSADDTRVLDGHRLLERAPVRRAGELVPARVRLLGRERGDGRWPGCAVR